MDNTTVDNRSFRNIYFALDNTPPKAAFVKRIAKITKRSVSAVRSWISDTYQPDDLAKERLEQELGIPAEVLFPGNKKKNRV